MSSGYHDGEKAVQLRARRQFEAEQLNGMVRPTLTLAPKRFLESQSLAVVGTVDGIGQVWASLLTGSPGFLQASTEQRVQINATPIPDSPLSTALKQGTPCGVIVIDLASRVRLRLNGDAVQTPDNSIVLDLRQVYFNCPQYIQRRFIKTSGAKPQAPVTTAAEALTSVQIQWINQADTFFITSLHPESACADASHRGGFPGFVQVLDSQTLIFPDYAGNNMFNTLGNIHLNPRTGILFLDFEQGKTLQLTGEAQILWDAEARKGFVGAERVVRFDVHQVLEVSSATSLRWDFIDYSPYNPGIRD
jgi:predicted pyridoxine 5'-phosphate oxidase superfamily flavin-nucleotide-binding protein